LKSSENLEFRILHGGDDKYKLKFHPDAFEWFTVKDPKVTLAEVLEESKRRGDIGEEKQRHNSNWMEGKSKDDVDQEKQDFEKIYSADTPLALKFERGEVPEGSGTIVLSRV
jgi:hypothetical protein